MPVVLSFLALHNRDVVSNHATYAGANRYAHVTVNAPGLPEPHRRHLMWNSVLHHLRQLPPDDFLILVTEDCLFVRQDPFQPLCTGRDALVPGFRLDQAEFPSDKLQIWRHTARSRQVLADCIAASKIHLPADRPHPLPDDMLPPADHAVQGLRMADLCNVRSWPRWLRGDKPLVLVVGDHPEYGGSPAVFREVLAPLANRVLAGADAATAVLGNAPAHPTGDTDVYQPGRAGALIMLYTPNIASFGAIAEASFRRYCRTHGLTLYVHRDFQRPGMSPAWGKPYLLREHLPDHDWVMWVDSDILAVDTARSLDELFVGRDIVAAQDIGPWMLNSGILGFRRTPKNLEILNGVCAAVEQVADKSSTYASGGDQSVFCQVLAAAGVTPLDVFDILTLNTPWYYRDHARFMVHYYGMQPEYRVMLMRHEAGMLFSS